MYYCAHCDRFTVPNHKCSAKEEPVNENSTNIIQARALYEDKKEWTIKSIQACIDFPSGDHVEDLKLIGRFAAREREAAQELINAAAANHAERQTQLVMENLQLRQDLAKANETLDAILAAIAGEKELS